MSASNVFEAAQRAVSALPKAASPTQIAEALVTAGALVAAAQIQAGKLTLIPLEGRTRADRHFTGKASTLALDPPVSGLTLACQIPEGGRYFVDPTTRQLTPWRVEQRLTMNGGDEGGLPSSPLRPKAQVPTHTLPDEVAARTRVADLRRQVIDAEAKVEQAREHVRALKATASAARARIETLQSSLKERLAGDALAGREIDGKPHEVAKIQRAERERDAAVDAAELAKEGVREATAALEPIQRDLSRAVVDWVGTLMDTALESVRESLRAMRPAVTELAVAEGIKRRLLRPTDYAQLAGHPALIDGRRVAHKVASGLPPRVTVPELFLNPDHVAELVGNAIVSLENTDAPSR